MHQGLYRAGDEPIVYEYVFFDAQFFKLALKVPNMVVPDAMAQDQILGTGPGRESGQPAQSQTCGEPA